MLNILSTLAGGLGSLKRACTLNMALMGAQQASYVVAFFLLQALMPDGGGGALSRAVWICLLAGLAVAYCVLNLRYLLAAFTGAYAISSSLRLRLCKLHRLLRQPRHLQLMHASVTNSDVQTSHALTITIVAAVVTAIAKTLRIVPRLKKKHRLHVLLRVLPTKKATASVAVVVARAS